MAELRGQYLEAIDKIRGTNPYFYPTPDANAVSTVIVP